MMRRQWSLVLAVLGFLGAVALVAPAGAQAQDDAGSRYGWHVGGFVDEDGDGFNDLAPDADGDGIPNGLDPDYQPPLDGTGQRFGVTNGEECTGDQQEGYLHQFMHKWLRMWQRMFGGGENGGNGGYGPGDGTGFGGDGPGDGTGFGPGDGTGDGPLGIQRTGARHGGGSGGGR